MIIRLVILNYECDSKFLEKIVGLKMDSYKKGEPIRRWNSVKKEYFYSKDKNGKNRKWTYNLSDVELNKDFQSIQEGIDKLLPIIKKVHLKKSILGKKTEIQVSAVIYNSSSDRPEVNISTKSINKLSEYGCSLDIDLY